MASSENETQSSQGSNQNEEIEFNRLHLQMISFITSDCRLFKSEWLNTWREFLIEYPEHEGIRLEDLRSQLFNNIFPRIFDYPLLPEQKKYLQLLSSYPKLQRTQNGFEINSIQTCLNENIDSCLIKGEHYEQYKSGVPNETPALIISSEDLAIMKRKYCTDPSIHAWISVLIGTEEERAKKTLLPYDEIGKRLKELQLKRMTNTDVGLEINFENISQEITDDQRFFEIIQEKIQKIFRQELFRH